MYFKRKTAYEIGTGDWSSDVCSSDLEHWLSDGLAPLPDLITRIGLKFINELRFNTFQITNSSVALSKLMAPDLMLQCGLKTQILIAFWIIPTKIYGGKLTVMRCLRSTNICIVTLNINVTWRISICFWCAFVKLTKISAHKWRVVLLAM